MKMVYSLAEETQPREEVKDGERSKANARKAVLMATRLPLF